MTDDALRRLGGLVLHALEEALTALERGDLALADRVVRDDLKVNRLRYELEEGITEELSSATGKDVRPLVGALYVLAELERMGDHAEGIAKVALMLGPGPTLAMPGVVGLAAGHDRGRGDSVRPGIDTVADLQPENGRQRRRRGMVPPVQQQDGGEGAEADEADGGETADEDGGQGSPSPRRAAAR